MARALLEETGFDLADVNKICDISGWGSTTPMIHFSAEGDLKMCRYLLSHGADCRKTDTYGRCAMFSAAIYGHLEIMQWLYHDGGTHHDITRTCVVNVENKGAYRWNTIPYSWRKES